MSHTQSPAALRLRAARILRLSRAELRRELGSVLQLLARADQIERGEAPRTVRAEHQKEEGR